MQILESSKVKTAAIKWGKEKEAIAFEQYVQMQRNSGHTDLYACKSGFVISEANPFLSASLT